MRRPTRANTPEKNEKRFAMSYGLRKSLKEVKVMLDQYMRSHGDTHYVFIAPFDLKACDKVNAFSTNIMEEVPVPDHFLASRNDLDIYFVERRHRYSLKEGDPFDFARLSIHGVPKS